MVDASYGAEVISSETRVLLFDQARNAISSEVPHFHKINIGRCGMCPRFAKRMNAGRYGDQQIYGEDVLCTELMS